MRNFSSEAKVGIFVIAGIIVLFFFTLKLGSISAPGKEHGIRISALFDSIAGLDTRAKVRYAGVEIGFVDTIELLQGKARVWIVLNPDVEIPSNATATVASLGLLGDKYIEIKGGNPEVPKAKTGDAINGSTPTSIDQLVDSINSVGDDLKSITQSVKKVVSSDEGEASMNRILENIDKLTEDLRILVATNRSDITSVVANIKDLTAEMKDILVTNQEAIHNTMRNFESISDSFQSNLPAILENIEKLSLNLNDLVSGNRTNLQETADNIRSASHQLQVSLENVSDISRKINAGEGTLGKLVTTDEIHTNLNTALENLDDTLTEAKGFLGKFSSYKTYLGYRGEYLEKFGEWRNIISVNVQAKKDKYYLLELTDSPFGHTTWEDIYYVTESSVTGTEYKHIYKETTTDSLLFSLQVAKRLDRLVFRGGLIESKGGVGVDVNLFRDKLKLSLDGWDFSRDEDMHLKLSSNLCLYDYFHIYAGWDDPLVTDNQSLFVGMGLSFEDEDLKFLLGLLPMASGSL